jgi:hypothetical protein
MADLLDRYVNGEHQAVWKELVALGDRVREESQWDRAAAVARETMSRVRANVERLIPRLEAVGYRFSGRPHTLPTGHEPGLIDDYERRSGAAVPLSLRAFYEVVGAVDFRGRHPDWPGHQDPLQVYGLDVTREHAGGWDGPVRRIYLCPCPLIKDGYSGVGPLYLVPGRAADGTVGFEGGPLPYKLVEYLRNAFRWGGFAGGVRSEDEFADYWLDLPAAARTELAADLVPL